MLRRLRPLPIESQCLNCAARDTPTSTETKRRKQGKKGGIRARYRRRDFRTPLPAIVTGDSDHSMVHMIARYKSVLKSCKPVKKIVTSKTHQNIEDRCGCFECTDWGVFLEPCDNLTELRGKGCLIVRIVNAVLLAEKARIQVKASYQCEEVEALCIPEAHSDLVVGNVPGARNPDDPDMTAMVGAVTTRAQARQEVRHKPLTAP
ncbi:hypothetical protein RRG08_067266 [Elysia crispata]|uniref:Uncharacterized protein n=1 Tax=Elysia crispata TaxID=231223 RepID=A0AAE0XT86_9GAST|nr:hypothetical protein RRG08_067266 [Elysia crispata]